MSHAFRTEILPDSSISYHKLPYLLIFPTYYLSFSSHSNLTCLYSLSHQVPHNENHIFSAIQKHIFISVLPFVLDQCLDLPCIGLRASSVKSGTVSGNASFPSSFVLLINNATTAETRVHVQWLCTHSGTATTTSTHISAWVQVWVRICRVDITTDVAHMADDSSDTHLDVLMFVKLMDGQLTTTWEQKLLYTSGALFTGWRLAMNTSIKLIVHTEVVLLFIFVAETGLSCQGNERTNKEWAKGIHDGLDKEKCSACFHDGQSSPRCDTGPCCSTKSSLA